MLSITNWYNLKIYDVRNTGYVVRARNSFGNGDTKGILFANSGGYPYNNGGVNHWG